jgi:cell division transport system permease protein
MSHESKYTPKYKNNNRIIEAKKSTRQTSHVGGDFSDKLRAYRDLHAHALFSSLGRLVASRFHAVLTIIVLSISISLACGFYLLVENVQQLTSDLETSNQISLFLRDDVSLASANRLANGIKLDPSVQTVKVITKEQALKEFEEFSGFGEATRALEKNPLPIVLQVIPKNSLEQGQNIETLVENFKQAGEVDSAQLDLQKITVND